MSAKIVQKVTFVPCLCNMLADIQRAIENVQSCVSREGDVFHLCTQRWKEHTVYPGQLSLATH